MQRISMKQTPFREVISSQPLDEHAVTQVNRILDRWVVQPRLFIGPMARRGDHEHVPNSGLSVGTPPPRGDRRDDLHRSEASTANATECRSCERSSEAVDVFVNDAQQPPPSGRVIRRAGELAEWLAHSLG